MEEREQKHPFNFPMRIKGDEFLDEHQLQKIIDEATEDTDLGVRNVVFPGPETGFGNNDNLKYWACAHKYQFNPQIARTCGTCRHSYFNGNEDGCGFLLCHQP